MLNPPTSLKLDKPTTKGINDKKQIYYEIETMKNLFNLIKYQQFIDRQRNSIQKWQCHLAFIAPTTRNTWSLTATISLDELIHKYKKLAITLPSLASQSTNSHAVILWGLNQIKNDALNATEDGWENLNLKMVLQGLAKSVMEMERFELHSKWPIDFMVQQTTKVKHNRNYGRNSNKNLHQQKALDLCSTVEFTGKINLLLNCINHM